MEKITLSEATNNSLLYKTFIPPGFSPVLHIPDKNTFSAILYVIYLWEQTKGLTLEKFLNLYYNFVMSGDKLFNELKLDYVRCLNLTRSDSNFIKSLEFLDEALIHQPNTFIPALFSKGYNIVTSHEHSFVEKTIISVAELCPADFIKLDIYAMACASYPGSFILFRKHQELLEALGKSRTMPETYITHFSTSRHSWITFFDHILEKQKCNFSPLELKTLLHEGKQCFSQIPGLYTLIS